MKAQKQINKKKGQKGPNSPLSTEELLNPVREDIENKEIKFPMNYESFKDLMVIFRDQEIHYQLCLQLRRSEANVNRLIYPLLTQVYKN